MNHFSHLHNWGNFVSEEEKQVAREFVEFFHGNFNTNVNILAQAYIKNARITVNGENFLDFYHFINSLLHRGIHRVDREPYDGVVQLIENDTLFISLTGYLRTNDYLYQRFHYHEEFVIRFYHNTNSFFITNHNLHVDS